MCDAHVISTAHSLCILLSLLWEPDGLTDRPLVGLTVGRTVGRTDGRSVGRSVGPQQHTLTRPHQTENSLSKGTGIGMLQILALLFIKEIAKIIVDVNPLYYITGPEARRTGTELELESWGTEGQVPSPFFPMMTSAQFTE